MKLVIAGVSGSGKSTIGVRIAELANAEFLDADDFHPEANIRKMRDGFPLTDEDRAGWLETLGAELQKRDRIVLACSALKKTYRDRLRRWAPEVQFVLLKLSKEELQQRFVSREGSGHFMPSSLLDSQLATLEVADDLQVFENNRAPEDVATSIFEALS